MMAESGREARLSDAESRQLLFQPQDEEAMHRLFVRCLRSRLGKDDVDSPRRQVIRRLDGVVQIKPFGMRVDKMERTDVAHRKPKHFSFPDPGVPLLALLGYVAFE